MSSGQRNTPGRGGSGGGGANSSGSNNSSSSNPISNELNNGMDYARQLQLLLNNPNSHINMMEQQHHLVQGIIASFNRAVTIVEQTDLHQLISNNSMMIDSPNPGTSHMAGGGMGGGVDSPSMVSGSGGGSCMGESTVDHRSSRRVDPGEGSNSKRKTERTWTKRVQASSETGFEAPITEDGYNWRKYGQKEINGARYQRGYYRCSLKSQGCNAKKLVQRCEEDNSIFIVTYRGDHTCQNYQSQVTLQPPTNFSSSPPSSSSGTPAAPNYPPAYNHTPYNPNPFHERETLISFKTWPTQQQPQQPQSNIYLNQFHSPQHPSSSGTNNPNFYHGSSSNNHPSIDKPPSPPLEPALPSVGQQPRTQPQPQLQGGFSDELQPAGHQSADPTDYDNLYGHDDFPFHHSHDDDFDPSVFYH